MKSAHALPFFRLSQVNGVEGFHANQLFLERYDTKNEYMVRSGEFEECQRSYLSESLPVPEYPSSAKYVDDVSIDDFDCEHWVAAHGSDSRRHIYIRTVREKVSKATLAGFGSSCGSNGRADDTMLCEVRIPYQLVDEYILAESQLSQPVMTYTLHNLTIGSPPAADFELPAPYTHKQCKRHIGGQPYFHLFSSYFMV